MNADGRIATVSDDGNLRLYGSDLKLQRVVTAPRSERPRDIAFSPDNSRLAVGYDTRFDAPPHVDVVDSRTLRKMFELDTSGHRGRLDTVTWSADGRILYAGGTVARDGLELVFAWKNEGRGPPQTFPTTSGVISGMRELSGGRLAVASQKPSLSLLDRAGSVLWQADSPSANFRDQTTTLKVGPDGKRVLFAFDSDGKSKAIFDVSQRALNPHPGSDSELVAARTEGLPITNWRNFMDPQLHGRLLALDNLEISRSLAIARDARSFWLGSDWALRHFDANGALIRRVEARTPWVVNLATDDRVLIAALDDGTIRWYRSADGAELLAFYPHSNRKHWVAWTPLGHYAASPGAEDFIQWQINRGLDQEPVTYSASRFRDQFYRPDVIERVLDVLDPRSFTAALLEAFDGKSDRPPPWLRVSDLEIWLAARVKELTNGAQTPTTTIPGERFINPRVFMVQQPPG